MAMMQRFKATYADLKPQDSSGQTWGQWAARIFTAFARTLIWCIFALIQRPSFAWLAANTRTLRCQGVPIELVQAAQASGGQELQCTVTDNSMGNHGCVVIPLLYRATLPVDQVKASLQRTLTLHPSFAGRLAVSKDGTFKFLLNNAGVALHTSSSPDALQDLLPAEPWRFWVPPDVRSAFGQHLPLRSADIAGTAAPPVRVALVHLAGGGTLLAVAACHILGDLRTLRSFMEHWAAAFRGSSISDGPPLRDSQLLEGLTAPPAPQGHKARPAMILAQPSIMRAVAKELVCGLLRGGGSTLLQLHVTKTRLRQLKDEATAGLDILKKQGVDVGSGWVSTNDALMARIWQVLSGVPFRRGASFPLAVSVDMRERVSPRIPQHGAGNVVGLAIAQPLNPAQIPLGELALVLRQALLSAPQDFVGMLQFVREQQSKGLLQQAVPAFLAGPHRLMDRHEGLVVCTNWDLDYAALAFGDSADAQPMWLLFNKREMVTVLDAVFVANVPPASPLGPEGGRVVTLLTTKANAKALLAQKEGL